MIPNWLKHLDYRLPDDLEIAYQDKTNEWSNKTFSIGIPTISVFSWLMYFTYLKSEFGSNMFTFVMWGQTVMATAFFALSLRGRARRFVNYFTPVLPMLFVFGLVEFHIAHLHEQTAMIQSRNWVVWVVFFLYAVERISPLLAVMNSVLTTLLFYYLQAGIPFPEGVHKVQFAWLMAAAHAAGVVICFDHCKNARHKFKIDRDLEAQRQQSEALLRNVLPETIVGELKSSNSTIAHAYENVTVLFADLVGFTKKSASMEADRLVKLLDELFRRFDELASKYGVEKIKTIGDAYMAATGCPNPDSRHAPRMVLFALQLDNLVRAFNREFSVDFKVKVGIASGKVMGGVIGKKRISFDLWGDVVNLASRIESVASGGEVTVSESTAALIGGAFSMSEPRVVDLKGKGPTTIYSVLPVGAYLVVSDLVDSKPTVSAQSKEPLDKTERSAA